MKNNKLLRGLCWICLTSTAIIVFEYQSIDIIVIVILWPLILFGIEIPGVICMAMGVRLLVRNIEFWDEHQRGMRVAMAFFLIVAMTLVVINIFVHMFGLEAMPHVVLIWGPVAFVGIGFPLFYGVKMSIVALFRPRAVSKVFTQADQAADSETTHEPQQFLVQSSNPIFVALLGASLGSYGLSVFGSQLPGSFESSLAAPLAKLCGTLAPLFLIAFFGYCLYSLLDLNVEEEERPKDAERSIDAGASLPEGLRMAK